jgi:hypothetical protein
MLGGRPMPRWSTPPTRRRPPVRRGTPSAGRGSP